MNYLIVTAHPSSKGFTHAIAKTIAAQVEKKGHTVQILDLYAKENELPFLHFEDIRQLTNSSEVERFQKMVMEAQELIFIHPLWWGNMPAIMKNWIDNVFSSGFAFTYTKNGPVGLLKGRSGRVFITGGSPWILYACLLFPFMTVWRLFVMMFCGIKVKSTTYFHHSPKTTDVTRKGYLAKVAGMFS